MGVTDPVLRKPYPGVAIFVRKLSKLIEKERLDMYRQTEEKNPKDTQSIPKKLEMQMTGNECERNSQKDSKHFSLETTSTRLCLAGLFHNLNRAKNLSLYFWKCFLLMGANVFNECCFTSLIITAIVDYTYVHVYICIYY